MIRRLTIPALAAVTALLGACGESPPPRADARELERAIAAIERQESGPGARLQEKVVTADRLASTVTKVAPGNLDADVVATLLR